MPLPLCGRANDICAALLFFNQHCRLVCWQKHTTVPVGSPVHVYCFATCPSGAAAVGSMPDLAPKLFDTKCVWSMSTSVGEGRNRGYMCETSCLFRVLSKGG
jgi:hypothetical protein